MNDPLREIRGLSRFWSSWASMSANPMSTGCCFRPRLPRAVEPRGSLSDLERSTIELFERVSPSVVQVVAHARRARDIAIRR